MVGMVDTAFTVMEEHLVVSLLPQESSKGKENSLHEILKALGPISQNGYFYSNDASSPKKKSRFQISVKSV